MCARSAQELLRRATRTVHNRCCDRAFHNAGTRHSRGSAARRRVLATGRNWRPRTRRNTLHISRDERGITTAEYAVGTAAGAGLAGLLYKLLTGGFGDKLLKTLFDHVLGLLGIG